MSTILSIGFKRPMPFWTALVFFAVAAGHVCENRLLQKLLPRFRSIRKTYARSNGAWFFWVSIRPSVHHDHLRAFVFQIQPYGFQALVYLALHGFEHRLTFY